MSGKLSAVLSLPLSPRSEQMLESPGWPRWIEEALACRPEPEGATNIPGAEAPAPAIPLRSGF